MSKSPDGTLKTSPVSIVFAVVNAAHASKLPEEEASKTPTHPT
jgi:hypothetical protein